jgi:hypothetical protein
VRRDYQDGRLAPEDWEDHRQELTAELEAAGAEAARLREQEAAVESWAELSDIEQATFERLNEIRRVIAGEADGEIDSIRAALARIFERFVLHHADSDSAPRRLHAELAMVGEGGFVIEPVIREEAIEGYSETMRPVLRREVISENKQRQPVAMKLANLARLDRNYAGRGLQRGARRDEEAWNRFEGRDAELHTLATQIRRAFGLARDCRQWRLMLPKSRRRKLRQRCPLGQTSRPRAAHQLPSGGQSSFEQWRSLRIITAMRDGTLRTSPPRCHSTCFVESLAPNCTSRSRARPQTDHKWS